MRITILTAGSRGDVQPFVALGAGLQETGHDVTVCTHHGFESMVTKRGLTYAYMNNTILDLHERPEVRSLVDPTHTMLRRLRNGVRIGKIVWPSIRRSMDEAWAAAQGAEAIVYYPRPIAGYHIAEKLGIPAFLGLYLPLVSPTRAFPIVVAPNLKLGGWYNRLTYKVVHLMNAPLAPVVNRWRRETLGLRRRSWLEGELTRKKDETVLYAFSRHLITPPVDWPQDEHVTGPWYLPAPGGFTAPHGLTAFLEAGEPPVYFGFGSMARSGPDPLTRIVLDAVRRSGRRAVIATDWGGLAPPRADVSDSVFVIDSAPHDWLFPRCAAVVHHGGAGTTAAGLRAGRPTIICPFFGDQPFWGRRVHALGVGPRPIPQRKLTADGLAAAIRAATTDEAMRRRAADLGRKMQAEDGVANAVEVINRRLARHG